MISCPVFQMPPALFSATPCLGWGREWVWEYSPPVLREAAAFSATPIPPQLSPACLQGSASQGHTPSPAAWVESPLPRPRRSGIADTARTQIARDPLEILPLLLIVS